VEKVRDIAFAVGREETWPLTIVLVTLEGQELPTICLIGPLGGPVVLGAVTLEEFALSVVPSPADWCPSPST
jgi:hypothetical protein